MDLAFISLVGSNHDTWLLRNHFLSHIVLFAFDIFLVLYMVGTSAAAPNAASVAILLLQANPDLTPLQIYSILEDTAIDMDVAGFDFDTWVWPH